jgi:5-methylcytosine-specific restriction endonuclease McrA
MEIGDMTAEQFAKHLQRLRAKRRSAMRKTEMKLIVRSGVTPAQRRIIFAKTGARCHICGGKIDGQWQADHVLAHSAGGEHAEENFLPAHAVCNNYRWHYSARNFS